MALKHAAVTAPTGVAITGALIHEKRTSIEDVYIEGIENDGSFAAEGKSLRKKTTLGVSGEGLSTLAMPTVGVGLATAASPKVDRSELVEKNEGAADFSVEAHYYEDGEGDFAAPGA